MKDELGDRMKEYEASTEVRAMPLVPLMARLDGRSFHAFTKHAARPFSEAFHGMMIAVTRMLVEETSALVGYTQSDEITLCWIQPSFKSQLPFDGRLSKLTSTLAAMASVELNRQDRDPKHGLAWLQRPTFDCRVWSVPNEVEASNVFVWRQADASRNSVSMAARAHFSASSLFGLSCREMQEKLMTERQINWNDYPAEFRHGSFILRRKTHKAFTPDEIESLPPMHDARRNSNLVIERSVVEHADLWLTKIVNREATLFHGEPWVSASA